MPKIDQCDSCQFYGRSNYLVCGVHPDRLETDTCIDDRLNPFEADF